MVAKFVDSAARNITTRKKTESLLRSVSELLTKPIQHPGQPVTSPALSRWGANDQTLPLGARAPPWTRTTCCQPLSPPGSNASGSTGEGACSLDQSLPRWWFEPTDPRSVTSSLSPVLPTHLQARLPILAQMQSQRQGASGKSLPWSLPSSPQHADVATLESSLNPMPPRHNGIETVSHNSALDSGST